MSIFDAHREGAFNTLLAVFGEEASWVPGVGQDAIAGKILIKSITEKDNENGVEHTPFSHYIEWQTPHFPGLYEAVREATVPKVTINSQDYLLTSVEVMVSGKLFKATAQKKL